MITLMQRPRKRLSPECGRHAHGHRHPRDGTEGSPNRVRLPLFVFGSMFFPSFVIPPTKHQNLYPPAFHAIFLFAIAQSESRIQRETDKEANHGSFYFF
jgi:hypothetical protein